MKKIVLSIALLVVMTHSAWAQDNEDPIVQSLTKELTYYQKKSAYLTKQSKSLSRRLSKLDGKNKMLVFKVEELRRDSLQLYKMIQDAQQTNQQLVKSYETRIQGMAGELHALHDSLADLKTVRRDLDLIKHYFDAAPLAKREYSLPASKVSDVLTRNFRQEKSPYEPKNSTSQEVIISETFDVKRPAFLFFKSTVQMQGLYKITLRPHPFDEGKTLVDVSGTVERKDGKTGRNDNTSDEKAQAETRLLNFMDKSIYSNDLHAKVSGHTVND